MILTSSLLPRLAGGLDHDVGTQKLADPGQCHPDRLEVIDPHGSPGSIRLVLEPNRPGSTCHATACHERVGRERQSQAETVTLVKGR